MCYPLTRNDPHPHSQEVTGMAKYIPYEKLSKKEKRRLDRAGRQTWGGLNPVTRMPENSRAYNRKKSQNRKREQPPQFCDFVYLSAIR